MLDFGQNCWLLVADTTDNAGNYEREFTAYVTGEVGECGIGDKLAERFAKETRGDRKRPKFDRLMMHLPDDRGCRRPCTIYSTPGWFDNGHGKYFKAGDEAAARKAAIKAETDGIQASITRVTGLKDNAHAKSSGWSPGVIKSELNRLKRRLETVGRDKNRFLEADLSVALIFKDRPSAEVVAWVKKRAGKFNQARKEQVHEWDRDPVTITGWRLIEVKVVATEHPA